ncbi:Leucine-rich repeat, cysteine-containing subtype [Corchorus olitorius]|uniref:Leucine-rich repeat, cysteine-containing subtype n=1 Tax=Corchorus olitorius TaxID=93759 RepID=A0A1R3IX64_9ROSI|nr:Leucine-rich repeat, cysteine-containing subtype [Corchorus olitorius]
MTKLLMPIGGVEKLPTDCWQLVFHHLNNDDLKAVSLVCKDFLTDSNLVKKSLNVIHPDVSMLSQQLKRFTQLKTIDFSRLQGGDLDGAIREVARSKLSLESLTFCREATFKTESLRELGSNSNLLKTLNRFDTECRNDNDLEVIANSFMNLEHVSIGHCPTKRNPSPYIPSDSGVIFLASKLKLLNTICIKGGHGISDDSIVALSLNCVFLNDVTIYGSGSEITETGIGRLLRNRPNLEALFISGINQDPSEITIENSISHAKSLTSLSFMGMSVSDKLLMEIAKAKLPLKDLQLAFCRNCSASGLLTVLTNNLRNLTMYCTKVDMDMVVLNGNIRNLTRIVIFGCANNLTKSTLFLLPTKCPSLVEMKIQDVKLELDGGAEIISLCKNHNIQNLQLGFKAGITSDELLQLFVLRSPNLRVLDLSYCHQVTSKGIEAVLKNCKFITNLKLRGYRKSMIIEADSELSELNLKVLELTSSYIDDEGLGVIARKCPRLMYLHLWCCNNVTTRGIKNAVGNINTLTDLRLTYCNEVKSGELLEWMLSTGSLASLKRITIPQRMDATEEQREELLRRGCIFSHLMQF